MNRVYKSIVQSLVSEQNPGLERMFGLFARGDMMHAINFLFGKMSAKMGIDSTPLTARLVLDLSKVRT